MFDFIPASLYTLIYYHFLLAVMVMLAVVLISSSSLQDANVKTLSQTMGLALVVLMIAYIGMRPVNFRFGDMVIYNQGYAHLQGGGTMDITKDYLFNYFMIFCAKIMPASMFFLLIDVIYVIPCYLFSKKYFGHYWLYAFFLFIASFSFWSYGTNGLRNGMATAVFIWGLIYYHDRKWLMYLLFTVSIGLHSSLIIPVAAFFAAGVIKNPKMFFYIWLLCIPLSIAGGGFWTNLFGSIGLGGDTRAADYLNADAVSDLAKSEGTTFSSTGFRWDFVLYSASAVFAGWYFILKKKLTDQFYIRLWGTFMIANAFWILVIRAAFSNRFAYLSWFLMAPVIIYPFVKYRFSATQNRSLAYVIAAYYLFTYFMFLKG
ncbi:EpsG family protein [Kaistella sp. DKR-2]|uniref:EpsG family protein n=1 Tax=Kaistella soli TaxID=2849654 RepID=UPI001C267EC0|nr:EpsG family protein [Kaistella soli]MBU8883062.1 EpsG family protein [Kaistella soli]